MLRKTKITNHIAIILNKFLNEIEEKFMMATEGLKYVFNVVEY